MRRDGHICKCLPSSHRENEWRGWWRGPVGVEDTEVTHGLNGLYGLARGEIDMRLWQLIDLCYGGQRREMTSGQGRPGGLTSSAAAAPPRLMLSVICQYWSVRGEGRGDYQKLSSTASLQSSNLNFRPAGLSDWRLAGSTSVILIITRGRGGGRMFLV